MSTGTAADGMEGWGIVFVRLALGIVFVVHGLGKVGIGPTAGSVEGFAGLVAQLGLPAPMALAWIATLVEIVGGLLVLVGLLARVAGALLAINMLVAIVTLHIPNGFSAYSSSPGYEYALVLMLISFGILVAGDGRKLSLERAVFGRELLALPG